MVTASDALMILQHSVKLHEFTDEAVLEAADVDRDGSITTSDALNAVYDIVGFVNIKDGGCVYTETPEMSLAVNENVVYLEIDESNWNQFSARLVWDESVEATSGINQDFRVAMIENECLVLYTSNPANKDAAMGEFLAAGVCTDQNGDGDGSTYTGTVYTLTFDPDLYDVEVTLYDGIDGGNVVQTVIVNSTLEETATPEAPVGETIPLTAEYFPDENFRAYLGSNCDQNGDGVLDENEIAQVEYIGIPAREISDLTGIGYFTALTSLNCEWNSLSELDVSANTALTSLGCDYNILSELDVSANTALTYLDCSDNNLSELDVSANTALTDLYCRENNLSELDVSANTALTDLDCFCNNLSELDVSANTALTSLNCGENNLSGLDVSANTALTDLSCYYNNLSELDVSANTVLTDLSCSGNNLSELDVSANTALTSLNCAENNLSGLDVGANTALMYLYCSSNNLSELDVSANAALTYLSCYYNNLSELDVSANTSLTSLDCDGNNLSELDVSANTSLTDLYCDYNNLSELDVSTNTSLTYLDCSDNNLSELDVSTNTSLIYLDCRWNQLIKLDLSNQPNLEYLSGNSMYRETDCANLTWTGTKWTYDLAGLVGAENIDRVTVTSSNAALENGVLTIDATDDYSTENVSISYQYDTRDGNGDCINVTLRLSHTWDEGVITKEAVCEENGELTYTCTGCGYTKTESTSATGHTWNEGVASADGTLYTCKVCGKTTTTMIPLTEDYFPDANFRARLEEYDLNSDGFFDDYEISQTQYMTIIGAQINDLTGIGYFTSLVGLVCWYNNLTELDLSANTALESLKCWSNPLTELDLSANTELLYLDCADIPTLAKLNVSGCTKLNYLYCWNDSLTELDVSNCTDLRTLNCENNNLTGLDLSANKALSWLSCDGEIMRTLDLEQFSNMWDLDTTISCAEFGQTDAGRTYDLKTLFGEMYLKNVSDATMMDNSYMVGTTVSVENGVITLPEIGSYLYFTSDAVNVEGTYVSLTVSHDWDDGVVTKEATETEEGEKLYTCKDCGATKTASYWWTDPDDGTEAPSTDAPAATSTPEPEETVKPTETPTPAPNETAKPNETETPNPSETGTPAPAPETDFTAKETDNGVSVEKYIGTDAAVVVPAQIDGKPVTEIGANAFADTAVKEIVLPESVTGIGEKAFANCENLETIVILGDEIKIAGDAFAGCGSLTIKCLKNSAAQQYAKEHNIACESLYYYGDVNMDGVVAAADALDILKNVVQLAPITDETARQLANIDGTEGIAASDALGVLKVVVQLQNKEIYLGKD